ncbi:MAG TPA: hypothetical protein VGB94_10185 [Acidobacteriaceae bacterium]
MMIETLPNSTPTPDPCEEACSGYGTQERCPPLIVLASAAQNMETPAEELPCLASALQQSKTEKEPRS